MIDHSLLSLSIGSPAVMQFNCLTRRGIIEWIEFLRGQLVLRDSTILGFLIVQIPVEAGRRRFRNNQVL